MAQRIHDKAAELGKEVLVITMLCSNPSEVRRIYGQELDTRQIPILHKNTDPALLCLYLGKCIKDGVSMKYDEWLQSEGIIIDDKESARNYRPYSDIATAMYLCAENTKNRLCYYLSPRDFITNHRDEIVGHLKQETHAMLDRMFPPRETDRWNCKLHQEDCNSSYILLSEVPRLINTSVEAEPLL